MLKSNIFNDKNIEEMNNKENNKMKDLKEENKSSKGEFVDKKDNFGKKSKLNKFMDMKLKEKNPPYKEQKQKKKDIIQ